MIREKYLDHWTRVTRMVGGQVVQTTCCCPVAGGGRRDCMRGKGAKNPCRCACHGQEVRKGLRFRQIDGEVPPMLPQCVPEKLAQIKAEIDEALDGPPAVRRHE